MEKEISSDNINIGNGGSEQLIMEIDANAKLVLLGVLLVPLWLTFVDLELIRDRTIFESLQESFQNVFREPVYFGIFVILELIMALSYYRTGRQKLTLTDKRLIIRMVDNISRRGLFRSVTKELALTEIKSVIVVYNRLIKRKFNCVTVVIEPTEGEKITLGNMINGTAFVDKVNYLLALHRQNGNSEPLSNRAD